MRVPDPALLPRNLPARVLIISHDVVGARMAGPGIRYWQLARVLAQHCMVTLAVPRQSELTGEGFDIQPYDTNDWNSLKKIAGSADVIMPCGYVIRQFPQLVDIGCPIVIDGYDPYLFETLASSASRQPELNREAFETCLSQLELECLHGDFYLCASERQRFWWLGMLQTYGRINPATYHCDPTLHNLVAVVPFGCASSVSIKTRPAMKEVMPNIDVDSKVLLWGGGIWEWLDPLTLLRAMRHVVDQLPNARLVFPGTRHPNPSVPDMDMRRRAEMLAQDLGLLGKYVFFGDWVPYADWQNYLLDADIGVSLHFDSLETQMAFRSRVLDYISGRLPMIVSAGDATSELVAHYDLGVVVGYEDVIGVSKAILKLLAEPRLARQSQFKAAQAALAWEIVARPLVSFCSAPRRSADHEKGVSPPRPSPSSVDQLDEKIRRIAQQDAEITQLRALIGNYERGRFMRFMRTMHRLRARMRNQ